MANIDTGAGGAAPQDIPKYTPPAPVVTPVQNPILNPGAPSIQNPILDPPASSVASLKSVIQPLITSDPSYLQQMEWLDAEKKKADERAAQEAIWWEKDYQLALQSLNTGGGGGDSGEAQQAALDALAKEQAKHQTALSAKQIQESMAARGMTDSGQAPFEQGELQYNYQNLLKEIDLRADARRAAAASAASARSSSINSQLANLQLQKEKHAVQVGWATQDRQDSYVNDKGQLVLKTGEALAQAWWDPNTSNYIGPGGERWDAQGRPVGSAASSSVVYTPPPASAAPDASWAAYNASQIKNEF